jgi:hypothetical protein
LTEEELLAPLHIGDFLRCKCGRDPIARAEDRGKEFLCTFHRKLNAIVGRSDQDFVGHRRRR